MEKPDKRTTTPFQRNSRNSYKNLKPENPLRIFTPMNSASGKRKQDRQTVRQVSTEECKVSTDLIRVKIDLLVRRLVRMQVKQFLPLCYVNKRIRETLRESDEKKLVQKE
jgi:hypothetical protein